MAKEKISLQFWNPCKYCLVKPACQKQCSLLKNHILFFETTIIIIINAMIINFTTTILSIIYFYTSALTTLIIVITYITISYICFIICYINDPDEIKTMKKHERTIVIVSWPLLVILVTIIGLNNKILMENKFPFRYHPSINPHNKTK